MKLLLFCSTAGPPAKKIRDLLARHLVAEEIETVNTIAKLAKRLNTLRHGLEIALLQPVGVEEIDRLLQQANLFADITLVVTLPTRDSETVSRAYKLYPRFVAYLDEGLHDLEAVLAKMVLTKRKRAYN